MSRYGYLLGNGQARLQRVSAGWVDTEELTVRKMAAEGATAKTIADAVGWTTRRVTKFIAANQLPWNRQSQDLHDALAAGSRSNRGLPVDTSWRPLAARMYREGVKIAEIARAVGRSTPTVRAWLLKKDAA